MNVKRNLFPAQCAAVIFNLGDRYKDNVLYNSLADAVTRGCSRENIQLLSVASGQYQIRERIKEIKENGFQPITDWIQNHNTTSYVRFYMRIKPDVPTHRTMKGLEFSDVVDLIPAVDKTQKAQ